MIKSYIKVLNNPFILSVYSTNKIKMKTKINQKKKNKKLPERKILNSNLNVATVPSSNIFKDKRKIKPKTVIV